MILIFHSTDSLKILADQDRVVEERLRKEKEEADRIRKEKEASGEWMFHQARQFASLLPGGWG